MKKKTHAQYLEELEASNPLFASGAFTLLSEYERATIKISCRCSRCGTKFEHFPHYLKIAGCPRCDTNYQGKKGITTDQFLEKLSAKNSKYANGDFEVVGNYKGALKNITCRCPKHGIWEITPSSLLKGSGCSKCANLMTEKEFFSKLTQQNDQYIKGDIEIVGVFVDRKTKIKANCCVCGHSWDASPSSLLSNHGCPNFRHHPEWSDTKTKSREAFLYELAAKHPNIELLSDYVNMSKLLEVRCKTCGHTWQSNGTKLITVGQGCVRWRKHPGYRSPKKKSHEQFLEDLLTNNKHYANNEFELLSEYNGMDNYIECRCFTCNNKWERTAYGLISGGSGCPECSTKRRGLATRKTHERFLTELEENNEYYATGKFEVVGKYVLSKEPLACHCLVCDNSWKANPQGLLLRGAGCPRCSSSGTSRVEQLITIVLERLLGEKAILNRDTTTIGAELDIVVPSHSFAIEYGAWFWHEHRFDTDLDKMKKCEELGIDLLVIYDQCDSSPMRDNSNVITYSFDLWSEQGHPALKKLVASILSRLGLEHKFSNNEWKTLRQEAASRTVLRTTDEFKEELMSANESYSSGKFRVVGEYTGNHNKIDCICNECGYKWFPAPSALLGGSGCPSCAGNLKKTRDEVIEEAARHNPDIEIIGEYRGASLPLSVRCRKCNYEWEMTPGSIRRGRGCPKARTHSDWREPTARTQEQFTKEVAEVNPDIEPLGEYTNANTKVLFRCRKCSYEWETKPAVIINIGAGCPKCSGRAKYTQDEFLEALTVKNKDFANGNFDVIGAYVNSKTKIKCRCHQHGVWTPVPNALLNGVGCPECGQIKAHESHRKTHEQFLEELQEKNKHYASGKFTVLGTYVDGKTPIECSCLKHGEWFAPPTYLLNKGSGCSKCRYEAKRFSHTDFLAKLRERNTHYANGEFEIVGEYKGNKEKIESRCDKHGCWETRAHSLLHGSTCPQCSSKQGGDSRRKTHEQFIADLLRLNEYYANGDFEVVGSYTDSRLPIECKCPNHGLWQATYSALRHNSRCPRCVSLANRVPNLAAQWHPDRNGNLTPWDVKPGSAKNVWWQCEQGHEWQQRIDRRYQGSSKCPQCRKNC